MRPRRRVGVVCPLEPPVAGWVDGLRRAVGDPAIDRIAPHVTLVAPVNVRDADLDCALDRLHAAAAAVDGPLHLTVGPPGSFLPANPVLVLEVGGDLDGLRAVRAAAFGPPLERPPAWPWVPHVTLADGLGAERIDAAAAALGAFEVVADAGTVALLEERRGVDGRRRWEPLADALLGGVATVGRGGLDVQLATGTVLSPVASALLGPIGRPAVDRLVVTARRDGTTVGAAVAWRDDDGGHVRVAVASGVRRQGV
ncbi:MAG TPA: 2'-5' RNA ligase family protein, partial [Acidimicrobiales bacterium]|nr:2'-5' RNA ligase family protein [Acidimicrobiales bacterium]